MTDAESLQEQSIKLRAAIKRAVAHNAELDKAITAVDAAQIQLDASHEALKRYHDWTRGESEADYHEIIRLCGYSVRDIRKVQGSFS